MPAVESNAQEDLIDAKGTVKRYYSG